MISIDQYNELKAENEQLRNELEKARKLAAQICALGSIGDDKLRSKVAFTESPRTESPKASPKAKMTGRSSIAVVKSDASQWEMFIESTTGGVLMNTFYPTPILNLLTILFIRIIQYRPLLVSQDSQDYSLGEARMSIISR